ncbi:MAG: hypothetical protein Q9218_005892 [Villophora microphyllina]
MARPFDNHTHSTFVTNISSTSVAANRAWDTSVDGTAYPASIKYDDAGRSSNTLGTSATSSKNTKGLRLAKIKSSPSHGALAAARSASRHGRSHRRGRSASETTSPVTPTFTSFYPSAQPKHQVIATPVLPSSTYAMPPPATTSKTKVKIRPLLRKMSSNDQKTVDLSKSVAENEGMGIYTSSDIGSRKTSSDVGYNTGRGYHTRNTSNTSHISTATTASHQRHGAQYVHPMRQTPRPYTPPLAHSFANSLESGSSTGAPAALPHDLILPDHTNPTPYGPLPSPRRIAPPLHVRTGSAPRHANTSQTNLPGTPSSLRKQSDNVETPIAMASTRTSFESMFRKRSRANTSEDPVVRAAQVAVLRKEFDERERLKEQARQEQESRKAQKEAKKQQKRDESQHRKSENRARKKANSNAASEKSAMRAYEAQQGSLSAQTTGRPQTKGSMKAAGGAGKAATSRWQLFVFWLKTMLLKMKKGMSQSSS